MVSSQNQFYKTFLFDCRIKPESSKHWRGLVQTLFMACANALTAFQEAVLHNDILNQTAPTFLMRRLDAFKLIWEQRDRMSPEMRAQMHDQCHDLEFHFSNVRDIPHVIESRRLADQFESYQPQQRPTTR